MKAKKELYIALIVFLTIFIFAVGLFWFFGMGQLSSARREHINAKLTLSELEQKTASSQDLLENFQKISAGRTTIEASLLPADSAAGFIENLEGLAASNNSELNLQVVEDTKRKKADNKLEVLTFEAELTGSFLSALSFLRQVDALPLLVAIDDINMRTSSTKGVITDITLRVFTH